MKSFKPTLNENVLSRLSCNPSKEKGGVFTTFVIFSQETQYLKNVLKVVFYPLIYYQIEDQVLRTRVMVLHIHMIVCFTFSAGNCKEKRVLRGAVVDIHPSFEFHCQIR